MFERWYEDWSGRLKEQINELTKRGVLTREQLAENMGISRSTLANWLSSKRKTEHLKDFDRLAKHVKLHPIKLLFGLDPKVIELAQRLEQLDPDFYDVLLRLIEVHTTANKSSPPSPQPTIDRPDDTPKRRVNDR